MLGKSYFDLNPSTVIHADSVSFLTSTVVQSNSEVFVGEFSMVKNECSDIA